MTRAAFLEPGDDGPVDPDAPRPARPPTIELAAAILIVGGVIGLISLVTSAASLPAGIEPFIVMTVALDVGSIVIGLLIRVGRQWVLAVNYVAVLGFVDLLASGGSPLALMLGVAEVIVVVILLLRRPWFDDLGAWRSIRRRPTGRFSP